jgi:membrane associated rhomboid family serine protease
LSCLFLNGPTPLAAFFDWLFLFFIMGPVETLMGTRRFLRGAAFAAGVALVLTILLDAVGLLGLARPEFYVGLNPVLLARLVFFGLAMPNAQILLFFVLPVRASWVAWVSGLLALLFFLYTPTISTSMALGGWSGAWLWSSSGSGSFRRVVLRFRKAKLEQELQRFEVLPGGKDSEDDDDSWVH